MTGRPKDPKTARNKNVLVIGGSGSGKTRFYVKPNLMQCFPTSDYPTSFVVTDPKGTLVLETGQMFQRAGYRVKILNTINFSKSMKYNPFVYIHSEKDVLKLVNTLIANTKGEGEKSAEDFWVKSERLFYTALIGYIWYEAPAEEMNFTTLLEMINASEAREDDPDFQSPVDLMFERLEQKDPDHFAVRQYKKFLLSAGKTRSSILISCGARLAPFDIREVRELIKIQRSLTTSNVAVFVPFVTQELFQSGAAMYYGINAKSHNMIMLDRKQARCPNGLKLGTPGSGKSMSCKSEIVSVFLTTADDIFISDPEAEYYPLVKRLHGQVIKLSPTSRDYVNPLDINLNYSEDDSPLALKSDFVLSFCELVMGGKTGLEAIERTVIDRAVKAIYRPYLANPCPENMPILSDLHQALLDQHLPEADRVAQALDLYVSGSLNVFNHKTNVDIHNRLVAFDIKELGKQLKKLGMLIIQDQIWGRVTQNRSQGRATWYFADEFHLLLKEEQTAAYSAEIWKRFRKWGGVPTGATQNVKDLLSSPEIENILENSDFITLLNQASGDRKILSERLNLSADQQKYIDNSEPGEGLLIFENVVLPFSNPIPKNTQLYKIMTTRLSEVVEL